MNILQRLAGGNERIWCNGKVLFIRWSVLGVEKKRNIEVGSVEWRAWLSEHDTLHYRDKRFGVSATLRKERRCKKYFYWYAYGYGTGRSEAVKLYLGKLENMPGPKLQGLMCQLAARVKERRDMTEAERARRRRRAAAARQRRYRRRLAGQAGQRRRLDGEEYEA